MSERNAGANVPRDEHVDEMTGLLYVEGQLEPARARSVSRHAEECLACRTLLRALERESRLLTRAMVEEDEALPARLRGAPGRRAPSLQWIWAAAFGLAATGVYALYTGYVQPWQQQLERAGFGGSNLLNLLVFQGAFWKGWQSMFSLFEVLALATLGIGAVIFLRRKLRRSSAVALIFAGLATVVALPAPADAAEVRHEPNFMLGKDEVIHNDVYVATQRARVDGTVDGDLVIFGENAEVSGHVTGDLIIFVRVLRMTGQVDGSVRVFSNTTAISGTVGRNVTSFSESLNLDSTSKVGGGVTLFTQSADFDGKIGRDILGFLHSATITGLVGGNIRLQGEQMSIGSGAEVRGKTHFKGRKEPTVSTQAKLASPVDFELWRHEPGYRTGKYYVWQIIWAAAYIVFGLVLFALLPDFSRNAVQSAGRRFGASLGLGVLTGCGLPIAAVIACVTVVGLFVGLATLFVWYGALYFGLVIVGALVGQWLMGRTSELWPLIGRMAVGVVIVRLLTIVPHVGWAIKYGTAFWGLGAISLVVYQSFQAIAPPATPGVPQAAPAV